MATTPTTLTQEMEKTLLGDSPMENTTEQLESFIDDAYTNTSQLPKPNILKLFVESIMAANKDGKKILDRTLEYMRKQGINTSAIEVHIGKNIYFYLLFSYQYLGVVSDIVFIPLWRSRIFRSCML